MDSRSACIQGVLKVKVKVKGHVIRALSWILGMNYSVIDGLVKYPTTFDVFVTRGTVYQKISSASITVTSSKMPFSEEDR